MIFLSDEERYIHHTGRESWNTENVSLLNNKKLNKTVVWLKQLNSEIISI
jgi:hypothetical protein